MCFILYDLYKYLKNIDWDYYQINDFFFNNDNIKNNNEKIDCNYNNLRKRKREY